MGNGQAHPSISSPPDPRCPLCKSALLTKEQILNEALNIPTLVGGKNSERWCDCGYLRLVDGCTIYHFGQYQLLHDYQTRATW
jgi:hypothetical protein